MRSLRFLGRGLLGISLATLLWSGCDSVDAAFDCQSVCSRYRTCFDQNYDVNKCRDNCRTRSANDPSVRDAADACESCIDDMSCASATFSCTVPCAQIIVN